MCASPKEKAPPRVLRWDQPARATLQGLSLPIQDELREVARDLHVPTEDADPDEHWFLPESGRTERYYFRRGLTRARRRQLNEVEERGEDLDSEAFGERAWDYVLVYRRITSGECIRFRCGRNSVVVMRIVTNTVLADAFRRANEIPSGW